MRLTAGLIFLPFLRNTQPAMRKLLLIVAAFAALPEFGRKPSDALPGRVKPEFRRVFWMRTLGCFLWMQGMMEDRRTSPKLRI